MRNNKWHKGPPPSLGWWPASINECFGIYRWWNGMYWSWAATSQASSIDAGKIALFKEVISDIGGVVKWKHRPKSWPKRSMT